MSEPVYIGIEGVALRHTTAVAANGRGHIIGAARLPRGISLHTTSRQELRCRLSELFRELLERSHLPASYVADAHVCIGLTGVTFPYNAQRDLPSEFERAGIAPRTLVCTGDAEIFFAGAAQCVRGTAILCHMGSTAYVSRSSSERKRFGGWGPVFGDDGSGFAMGLEVLRAISEEYDRRQNPSILWVKVAEWLANPTNTGAADPAPSKEWRAAAYEWKREILALRSYGVDGPDQRSAIFGFSHAMLRECDVWAWRSSASGLTIPLFRAVAAGDPQARAIVSAATSALVKQHAEMCRLENITPSFGPLVLAGGVITHNKYMETLIVEQLAAEWQNKKDGAVNIISPKHPESLRPVCGALLFALGKSENGVLSLPPSDIIMNVRRDVATSTWKELRND